MTVQRERPVAPKGSPPKRLFREHGWVPWALFITDVFTLELALWLAWQSRLALVGLMPVQLGPDQFRSLALAVALLPVIQAIRGMYPGYGMGPVARLRDWSYVIVYFFGALAVWDYLVLGGRWSRGVLLIAAVYAAVLIPLAEALFREATSRLGAWGVPVVVLGAARTGALVVRLLGQNRTLGLVPVALFDDDPDKVGMSVEGVPVVGPIGAVNSWIGSARVAIVAMPGVHGVRIAALVRDLHFPRVVLVPDLFGVESLWVQAKDLGGVLGLEIRKNLLVPRNRWIKRALDYFLGVPLALASAPLVGLFALWVKRVDPGPAFYSQAREGQHGKLIRVWKLRTMYPDAEARLERYLAENPAAREEWRKYFKLKNDPRILPVVGHFLRRTSLDELPQLWNIVRGEMSLVGPRPFPQYHLEEFSHEFRELRRQVLPGITGLWQVSSRSEGDLEVQEALDTYYIRNWSVWLDLYILARTVLAVLARKGAY